MAVEAEQRVEHQEAVVARLVGRGPHRIEHRKIRLGDELQDLAASPRAMAGAARAAAVEARKCGGACCGSPGDGLAITRADFAPDILKGPSLR